MAYAPDDDDGGYEDPFEGMDFGQIRMEPDREVILAGARRERPTTANYISDLSYEVATADHQDHAFFGIMFDVSVKTEVPLECVVLSEIFVRGDLGQVTVWWTKGTFNNV